MIKKRTILAFGLGAAAAWYADPVSGAERRLSLRRLLDSARDHQETLVQRVRRPSSPDARSPEGAVPQPPTGATAGASSLDEVLVAARRQGATTDMSPTGAGSIRCGGCGSISRPDEVGREWVHRLEGSSDPDELLSASAIRCPRCDRVGVLVLPFGPLADEVEADIARRLPDPRHHDMAPIT